MRDRAVLHAPAKVNLRLKVLAREESGFHAVETVFCGVSLADEVEVRRSRDAGVRLTVEGEIDTGPPERNLVVRAAARFYRTMDAAPAVELRLRKRIPSAAGLGGGSSDAAATLRALNALEDAPFTAADLLAIGAELGSDVPFFLCGSPFALAWSRGERLLALPALPSRPVLLAHPGTAMPTPEAFRRLAAGRGTFAPAGQAFGVRDLSDWTGVASLAGNDFEPIVTDELPVLARGIEAMRAAGAELALLSGSGAAVYGIFRDAGARDAAAAAVERLGLATWAAETLETLPEPRLS